MAVEVEEVEGETSEPVIPALAQRIGELVDQTDANFGRCCVGVSTWLLIPRWIGAVS